jgi:hypothetical protein
VNALALAGELGGAEERKTYRERLGSVPNEVGVVSLSYSKPFKPEVSVDPKYKPEDHIAFTLNIPNNFVDKAREFTAETYSCNGPVDSDSTAPFVEGCFPACSTSASKVLEVSPLVPHVHSFGIVKWPN